MKFSFINRLSRFEAKENHELSYEDGSVIDYGLKWKNNSTIACLIWGRRKSTYLMW